MELSPDMKMLEWVKGRIHHIGYELRHKEITSKGADLKLEVLHRNVEKYIDGVKDKIKEEGKQ